MGFLRLGAITRFLSDPVVSGFTTGAAVVIITSQINPIFGLNIPRYSGLFSTVMVRIRVFIGCARTSLRNSICYYLKVSQRFLVLCYTFFLNVYLILLTLLRTTSEKNIERQDNSLGTLFA